MKTYQPKPIYNLDQGLRTVRILALLAVLLAISLPALGINRSWQATGGDGNWSNPNNWSPVGAPQNGDDLIFNAPGTTYQMTNDLDNLVVRALFFERAKTISGKSFFLTDAISHASAANEVTLINVPTVTLSGDVYVTSAAGPEGIRIAARVQLNGHELRAGVNDLAGGLVLFSGGINGLGLFTCMYGTNIVLIDNGPAPRTPTDRVRVEGGMLRLNCFHTNAIGLSLEILPGGTVKCDNDNQIRSGASVLIHEGGELLLNGFDNDFEILEMRGGRIDSGSGGNINLIGGGSIKFNATNAAAILAGRVYLEPLFPGTPPELRVNGSFYPALDMQAQVFGTEGFVKLGNATLMLNSNSLFTGDVYVNAGIVEVRANQALGNNADGTWLQGGSLVLRNVSISGESLRANGVSILGELPGSLLTSIGISSWSGPVTLNTNLVVASGDMTFTGPISGSGGLACFSAGTMRLGGTLPNTFTGPTLVRCPLMEFAKPSSVKAYAGPLIVGGGAGGAIEARWLNSYQNLYANVTLYDNGILNLNNFFEDVGPLTFNGGTITTGTGELGLYGLVTVNSNVSPATVSGKVGLPSGYREFRVADGSASPDLQINAVVLGAGNVQKTGTGQMVLAGANTYAGLTLLEAGTLIAQHATALGGTSSGTIVLDGATLAFQSVPGPVGEGISLRGAGVGGTSGALNVTGTTLFRNAFPSIYAALDLTTNATIRVESGGRLTTDGFVSGLGPLVKTGAGSLVFSNANPNTYTGDTLIQGGTLELRKPASVIAVPGNLILGPASAGTPATVRWFQTGGVNASSHLTVNANSLLDLNGNNQNVNRLNLNDGGDVQTGAGKMTFLTGGPITVGTLNPANSPASSSFSGLIGLPANDTLIFNVGQYASAFIGLVGPELEVSAAIPVPVENVNFTPAGLFKSGGGELRLSGNNGFKGPVDVAAGSLTVGSATALGTTSDGTYVTGGANLNLINNITISGETLFLNSTNSAALNNLGGNNTWTGPITLSRASNIGVNTDWSLLLSGAISGSGSLTKVGAGTLTLSGAANNTHAGNTFVNAGTLALSKVYGFQAVPASLVIGQSGGAAALVRFLNHDQVWQNITINGSGLLDLNNFDEYAADVTINGGGDVQTGTGALYVLGLNGLTVNPANNNPATITGRLGFDAGSRTINVAAGTTTPEAHDLDISAVIFQANPTVNLTKTGAGRARFGGTNTYTGTTTVSGGQLQIDGGQPQSPVLVSGARLQGSGVIGHVTFSGSTASRLAPGTSAGILTTSNFNANAVGGGALELDLNGAVAGNSYDQVNVRGSVNLTGLSLQSTLNFTSTATQPFTLINNDASDAVIGTFTGLPQNKKFYLGGELFQISYTGGTGNDVVLTRLITPPPPTLSIERIAPSSVRLIWPTNDPAFSLQSNTNLTDATWITATPLPTVVGTNNIVTNSISGSAKFYRLINP